MRTGDEYRRGLLDDRRVWFRGELVRDVTSHVAFRRKVDATAKLFDAMGCNRQDVEAVSLDLELPCRSSFLIPRNSGDLAVRRRWSEWVARATLGLMGRSPDYLQTAMMSFAAASHYFESNRTGFGDN